MESAHLKPYVSSLPQGLMYEVAEEGQNFRYSLILYKFRLLMHVNEKCGNVTCKFCTIQCRPASVGMLSTCFVEEDENSCAG